MNKGIT